MWTRSQLGADHPMTQGKIERDHRSMKNVVKLEKYCSPWALQRALARFVEDDNHRRYHESLQNVTPADVYYGRRPAILARREQIKLRTLHARRRENLRTRHNGGKCLLRQDLTGPDWSDDVHPQQNAIAFLDHVIATFPFRIHTVRTDRGHEFQAQFHWHLADQGIQHVYIKPRTPRLNGKGRAIP